MSQALTLQLINLVQVSTVLFLSPLIPGVIAKAKALVESRRGPSVLQPYYDLAKLLRKEVVLPEGSSAVFVAAPFLVFSAYLVISLVIPVVTPYPLPYGILLDLLGGALMFGFAGIVSIVAALDARTNYTAMGASRSAAFAALAEPTLIMVFFGVALITGTNNPYTTNNVLAGSPGWYFSATHLLVAGSFFMLLLFETGKLPVESSGLMELGMLDDARAMEYSGRLLALVRWGGYMKQFMLMAVFLNVFAIPWWISPGVGLQEAFYSVGTLSLKMLLLCLVIVLTEETLAKLRLFKILDYLAISFSLGLLSVVAFFLVGGGA
ncbi:MAG: NADH-quinone oxidoreductase subunit H [Nitrososphaerota archaeon]|nr:NADH-quinone oxidoreductase subunit H [Nitrososphaerota archaeon]MDG6939274.1 NADH-quinone oxidoreductase subunit H [Nitrososphaerota archaeon]